MDDDDDALYGDAGETPNQPSKPKSEEKEDEMYKDDSTLKIDSSLKAEQKEDSEENEEKKNGDEDDDEDDDDDDDESNSNSDDSEENLEIIIENKAGNSATKSRPTINFHKSFKLGMSSNQKQESNMPMIDFDKIPQINGKDIYEIDLESFDEKPWRKPGADITDYFNYGFNENSWKQYASKQVALRQDNTNQKKITVFQSPKDVQETPVELQDLTKPTAPKRVVPPPPVQHRMAPMPYQSMMYSHEDHMSMDMSMMYAPDMSFPQFDYRGPGPGRGRGGPRGPNMPTPGGIPGRMPIPNDHKVLPLPEPKRDIPVPEERKDREERPRDPEKEKRRRDERDSKRRSSPDERKRGREDRSRSRERDRERDRDRDREKDKDKDKESRRDKDRDKERDKDRRDTDREKDRQKRSRH